ncbi:4911_t:CDS:2, partial [Racocetra persica]
FIPVWEFHHLFPGHGRCGSSRSDLIAIVVNQTNLQFLFFLIEFEQNGFEVHKDEIVAVFEAAHEFNRILSLGDYQTEDETNNVKTDVENVLKLVTYLREVVCHDGDWIKNMIILAAGIQPPSLQYVSKNPQNLSSFSK